MPVTSELNLQGYFLTHQDPDQGQEKTLGKDLQSLYVLAKVTKDSHFAILEKGVHSKQSIEDCAVSSELEV